MLVHRFESSRFVMPRYCLPLLILLCVVGSTAAQSWKHYPLVLEGNEQLTFPEIEGPQYQDMGDSWFFTAEVSGQTTGNRYQLVTIFSRNYITAAILNFYQVSIFNYDSGDFNTHTAYDLPGISLVDMKFHATPGSLDIGFNSSAGPASWTTVSPFNYSLQCPGTDHLSAQPFDFQINADMQKEPVAYGASTLRGFFTFYAQPNTLTYFEPGPLISGTLTMNGVTESIQGTKGHIDRQVFPLYAGVFTPTGRQHSHEWRQINLDNGVDLALWRQFDRTNNNTVIETTGSTVSLNVSPGQPADAIWRDGLTDLQVEYISYQKYPRANFSTLFPPPSANMYLPSEHIIRSSTLNMTLRAKYTTPAPVAMLPIEYFEGPAVWNGSIFGQTVEGVGIFESTLALYRDWELGIVLLNSVAHLPETDFGTISQEEMVATIQKLEDMVSSDPLADNRVAARLYLGEQVVPALNTLMGDREAMLEIANDFNSSLDLVLQF